MRGALAVLLVAAPVFAQSARIVLRWKEVAGASAYELQIARDSTFVEVVLQTRTTTAGYRWDDLPSSTHWWRVRSFDEDGRPSEWSAPRTISVNTVVPDIARPEEGGVQACGGPVEVELVPSQLIKEYVLDVASNPAFQGARELKGTSPTFSLGALAPGAWFLRARARDLKGKLVGPGPTRSFLVRTASPRLKPSPEVTVGVAQVQLGWGEVACAKSYLLEVTSDARERVSPSAKEAAFAFKPTQAGDYRWRVAGVDESGTTGEWSADGVLRVRLPAPAQRQESVTTRAELAWGAVPTATTYRVEVYAAREASKPLLVSTVTASQWRTPDLEAGRYTWRVQAKDARGHASPWSELKVFDRKPLSALATPQARHVADVALGEALVVEWGAVEGASQYEVTIDGEAHEVTALTFSAPLLEGWHRVKVRALHRPLRESPFTAEQELYAGQPPVESAEVRVVGEDVHVQLVDRRGVQVRAAKPTFTVRHGALGATQQTQEQWEVRWLAPPDGRDVLVVEERAFKGEYPLVLESPPWFWAALGAGGVFNGGAVASFSGAMAVGYRLPFFARRAGVEVRGGYFSAGARLVVGEVPFVATTNIVPISVLFGWQQPVGAYVLRGGLGPSLQLAVMTVNEARETRALPGLELAVSLGRALGPGRVEVELGFSYARFETKLARLNAGGVALRVGYAIDFGPR